MYCPSCGSEISVELKYCNRCGAYLAVAPENYAPPVVKPMKVALPAIVFGLTVTIGLGIIFGGVTELARIQLHPAAIAWIAIFSLITLFGCTALMFRLWLKVLAMNREMYQPSQTLRAPGQMPAQLTGVRPQFPPRLEPVPSVTEHTTRTFSPAYRGSDPAAR